MSALPQILSPAEAGEQVKLTLLNSFQVDTATLQANKDKYMNLSLADLEDKNTYESAKEGRKEARETRYAVQNKLKEFKGITKEVNQKMEEKAEEMINMVSPIEEHCHHIVTQYEEEKERKKIAKLEEKAAAVKARVTSLLGHGARFDGSSYNIGTLWIEHEQLVSFSDQEFMQCVALAEEMAAKVQAEKEAKEKAEAEEREAQRLKEEAAAAEKKRLEEELAEMRRQKAEAEAKAAAELEAIRKEKEALEAEKLQMEETKRKEEQAKLAAEKAEADRLAAEAKAKQDEEERVRKEAEAAADAKKKADAARQKELKPEKALILVVVNELAQIQPALSVNHPEVKDLQKDLFIELDLLVKKYQEKINNL